MTRGPMRSVRPVCLSALLIAIFLVAGCAGLAGAPPASISETSTSENTAIRTAWTGRLALQVDGVESQSFSASFDLRGGPRTGELSLFTPIGSTLAVLNWSPGDAVLRTGQEERRSASLETLAQQATGTAIPVAALFDWLAGTPTPVPGWQPDLRQQAEGRITARRTDPLPTATLRVVLDR